VVRLREFDRFARNFLDKNPTATVVYIGCGLDARFQRLDNGKVRWFDLDLPDVIIVQQDDQCKRKGVTQWETNVGRRIRKGARNKS